MAATIDDVTDMLVFARVVEEKSFTAAARQLGLSKSVVSARVMRLEGRLGERLLHRTTRRLALTDAGLRFYDRCARVAAEADEAAGVAEGVGAAVRGSLRMTAPVGFAQLHLTAPLAAFLERWPEVRLELSVTDRRVDIVGERFDVAVRMAARMADSSLVARRIATDRMRLIASPAYLARRGAPASPNELVHHTCLRYSRQTAREEWAFVAADGTPLDVSVDGPLALSSGTLLREAALAGLGLAILPESEIAGELRAGRLVALLDGTLRDAETGVHVVHAYVRDIPARVRALVDHLATWFRTPRWSVSGSSATRR
ncbi:MAG TPA: LysR family transcriptional regulator [Haliangiales bacterium]|nr:LysR family transcriptional regulator [Haliangiales bacterium]